MKCTKIVLSYKLKDSILAVGGQSKAGFCLTKGNVAYLLEFGGDLSDLTNLNIFKKQIKDSQKKINITPISVDCRTLRWRYGFVNRWMLALLTVAIRNRQYFLLEIRKTCRCNKV